MMRIRHLSVDMTVDRGSLLRLSGRTAAEDDAVQTDTRPVKPVSAVCVLGRPPEIRGALDMCRRIPVSTLVPGARLGYCADGIPRQQPLSGIPQSGDDETRILQCLKDVGLEMRTPGSTVCRAVRSSVCLSRVRLSAAEILLLDEPTSMWTCMPKP